MRAEEDQAFQVAINALQTLRLKLEKTVHMDHFDELWELIHEYAGAEFDRGALDGSGGNGATLSPNTVYLRFECANAAFQYGHNAFEGEVQRILHQAGQKILAQRDRKRATVCFTPEAEDLLKDSNGNTVGVVHWVPPEVEGAADTDEVASRQAS